MVPIMEYLPLQSPSATSLFGTVGILLALYFLFSRSYRQTKDLPGPRPLPVLGNLLQLDLKSPNSTLCELSKKYGPIFTFYFGPKKVVVLAGYKIIKQALVNNDAFSEREVLPIISDLNLQQGLIFANGPLWKEMKQFVLTNLKDFGMGKKAIEEKIIQESQHLIDAFKEKDGKAFDTSQLISFAVSNIISSMVYGSRFEYDDPEFLSMVDRTIENVRLMGSVSVQLYNLFPRLFSWIAGRKQLMKSAFDNRRCSMELIRGLQDTFNPQTCRGVVDSFLVRKIHFEASGKMNSHYSEDTLLMTVVNLFTAGTDTMTSSITYGLLLMAKYPQIQDRVQEELSRVVGSRQIQVVDRKNLPYTDAVVHEMQRVFTVVPSVFRYMSQDVTLEDYVIKKGSPVMILLSSAHKDEDEWEKPFAFNPAHFLDEQGNFRKRAAFVPFSLGVRACIGESLARMEVFLFFASLLQHFRFTPPPGVTENELDLRVVEGFTQVPFPHELCAISRV